MQSLEYLTYLAESLDLATDYTEYISENIKKTTSYAEYIAANLSNNGPIGISGSCGASGISGVSGSCGSSGNSGETYKNENKLPFLEIYEILPYSEIEKINNPKFRTSNWMKDYSHMHSLYE